MIKAGRHACGLCPISSVVLDILTRSLESNSSVDNINTIDISLTTCTIAHSILDSIQLSIATKLNHLAGLNAPKTPAR
jgi:hypothetical protein